MLREYQQRTIDQLYAWFEVATTAIHAWCCRPAPASHIVAALQGCPAELARRAC